MINISIFNYFFNNIIYGYDSLILFNILPSMIVVREKSQNI